VSAVVPDAVSTDGLLKKAVVLFTGSAHVTATAACPGRVDADGVATLKAFHSRSQLFHPAGDLMSEREGQGIVLQ
jgi:hypothetical protein